MDVSQNPAPKAQRSMLPDRRGFGDTQPCLGCSLDLCSLRFACDAPSGIYYWQNASRKDRAKVRLETTDDDLTTELFITAVSPPTNVIRRLRRSLGGRGGGRVGSSRSAPSQWCFFFCRRWRRYAFTMTLGPWVDVK